MTATSKTKERDRDAKLASGTQAHLMSLSSLMINGQPYTPPQIVQRFDDRVTLLDKATTARTDLATAVKAEKLDRPEFAQFVAGFRAIVSGMFRNDPKTLGDFNMAPRKTTKPTAETKVNAVAKARATRKARHTMGKKQRKDIKGVVPAPEAPAPAPATPATPAASPAPAPVQPVIPVVPMTPITPAPQPTPAPAAVHGASPQAPSA